MIERSFFLPIVPPTVTSQQKGVAVVAGTVKHYTKPAVADAQATLMSALLEHRIPEPLDGPITLMVHVTWPYLASDISTKVTRGRTDYLPHVSRPDLDNWLKGFIDQLVKAKFIKDDNQIAVIIAVKRRGPQFAVGIEVSMTSVPWGTE